MTDKTVTLDGKEVPIITADVKTTLKHKKTGTVYSSVEDAASFGVKKEELQQDVLVKLPKLDLFAKTK
jgi:hypothetical protein|tara:strand:+ start:479 stop:682 length:204 start_codon:yes stop_codon:yes gene_type:complete